MPFEIGESAGPAGGYPPTAPTDGQVAYLTRRVAELEAEVARLSRPAFHRLTADQFYHLARGDRIAVTPRLSLEAESRR